MKLFLSWKVGDHYQPKKLVLSILAQDLVQILAKVPIWHNLRTTMITKELRQFAQRLEQWGKDYHCQRLIDYAHRLEDQHQEFDSDNLTKTLESFPDLVRSLQ